MMPKPVTTIPHLIDELLAISAQCQSRCDEHLGRPSKSPDDLYEAAVFMEKARVARTRAISIDAEFNHYGGDGKATAARCRDLASDDLRLLIRKMNLSPLHAWPWPSRVSEEFLADYLIPTLTRIASRTSEAV